MSTDQRRRFGFTLIELLVVIAIIAILAAILFPVFAQARDKARASACLSNTKQMGVAIQMYAQDYDETLPEYWDDPAGESHNKGARNDNPQIGRASCRERAKNSEVAGSFTNTKRSTTPPRSRD